MLRLSKEKQFTWEKAAKAQKVEKIQKKEKPLIKVSMEISTNLEAYSEPSWISMMDLLQKYLTAVGCPELLQKQLFECVL